MNIIFKKPLLSAIASIIIIFLCLNYITSKISLNIGFDLTETKTFSVSEGTKTILKNIEEPIAVNFYYSRNVAKNIPMIQTYASQIEGLLKRYVNLSNNKIQLNIINPDPFSEQEDQAERSGLQGFPVGADGTKLFFGLSAKNSTDDSEKIAFFDPSRNSYLESDITNIIYKLNEVKKPKLGFLSWVETIPPINPDGKTSQGEYIILKELGNFYEIEFLEQDTEDIKNIDLLVVYHPSNVSNQTEYAIEQYILNGGKTVIFLDPYFEKMDHSNKVSKLDYVLKTLDINFNENIIADGIQATRLQGDFSQNTSLKTMLKLNWPEVTGNSINSDEAYTQGLSLIRLVSPGGLSKLNKESDLIYIPILSSSTASMEVDFEQTTDPIKLINEFKPSGIIFDFAARVYGNAKSSFNETNIINENHIEESIKPINVVVFSDADFIRNSFWARIETFLDSQVIDETADNGALVTNVFDTLTGYEDLLTIRKKQTPFRPFTVVQELQAEAEREYLGQEQELQNKLDDALNKIQTLSSTQKGEELNLTEKQIEELAIFQNQVEVTRKELRQVRRELRKDIDNLGNLIKAINTLAVPILVIALLFILPRKIGIKKRKNRTQ
ncbi:MAG: hypothetical protein CMI90_06835 [Pelagibacteraceae bacterium]|nr:hypothetical protein [Pelagibacteraceae bacterium]